MGPPADVPCRSRGPGDGETALPSNVIFVPNGAEGAPGSRGPLRCCLGLLHPCAKRISKKCPGPQQDLDGAFCNPFCSGWRQWSRPALARTVSEHLPVPVPHLHSWDVRSASLKASAWFPCSPEQRVFSLNDTYWEVSSWAPGVAPDIPIQAPPPWDPALVSPPQTPQ